MGYQGENSLRSAIVFDVETCAIPDAAQYVEEPTAPGNYAKPEAIAGYIAKVKAKQLEECALDVDLARIVALAWQCDDHLIQYRLCSTEGDERDALVEFWDLIRPYPYPRLIGWNVCGFDLPMMIRRSLYLGIDAPPIQLGKYKHPDVDDLMLIWSLDGALKYRGLSFVCKRLGIDVPDTMTGADIGKAVAENRWEDVAAHVTADVKRTIAIAQRLGYFSRQEAIVL